MTSEKYVRAGIVDALFRRALKNRLTPSCRELLRGAGLDLDQKLASTYSLAQWKEFLRIAADHVYAGVPAEAAYYSLGERALDGYLSSLSGHTLLGLLRLSGPRRALRMARLGFRMGTSFSDIRVQELGPTELVVRFSDVLADQPTFIAGLLARLAEVAGGQRVVALPEEFNGRSATFHVRWLEQADAAPDPLDPEAAPRASLPRRS